MRTPLLAAAVAAVLPLAPAAHSQSQPQAPPAAEAVRLDFTEETLPNGLEVILHVDCAHADRPRGEPLVPRRLEARAAGAQRVRPPVRAPDVLHGSRNVAEGQLFAFLEAARGASERGPTGTTSNDRTNYFEPAPSHSWSWRSGWRATAWGRWTRR